MAIYFVRPYNQDLRGFYFGSGQIEKYIDKCQSNDFEHEIEIMEEIINFDSNQLEFDLIKELFSGNWRDKSKDELIEEFQDVNEKLSFLDKTEAVIIDFLINEYSKSIVDALEDYNNIPYVVSIEELTDQLNDRAFSGLELPKDHPLVLYFDVDQYMRDSITNGDYLEYKGIYLEKPSDYIG